MSPATTCSAGSRQGTAVGPALARFRFRVALLVIGTSSVGYLLGAIQIDHFAFLPDLEFAKITIQGACRESWTPRASCSSKPCPERSSPLPWPSRRSNNFIVTGYGAGRVLYRDGHRDFQPIQQGNRGWFASRDDQHKAVAFVPGSPSAYPGARRPLGLRGPATPTASTTTPGASPIASAT